MLGAHGRVPQIVSIRKKTKYILNGHIYDSSVNEAYHCIIQSYFFF